MNHAGILQEKGMNIKIGGGELRRTVIGHLSLVIRGALKNGLRVAGERFPLFGREFRHFPDIIRKGRNTPGIMKKDILQGTPGTGSASPGKNRDNRLYSS
jgi:hypothetical protein